MKPTILGLAGLGPPLRSVMGAVWDAAQKIYFTIITYVLLVAVVWAAKGRPPLSEFMETSILTRHPYKRLCSQEMSGDAEEGKLSGD